MGDMTLIHRDPSAEGLAHRVSGNLVELIQRVQDHGDLPRICLTGGRVANQIYAQLLTHPGAEAIDWGRTSWWWGDERFVPSDSPDRNEGQARELLLDHVAIDSDLIHAMPADDGSWPSVQDASRWYAEQVSQHCPDGFDVVLLSIGEDGHVASLFPGASALNIADTLTIAITNSPKPPSRRITLSLPALSHTRHLWFLASGSEKADAVRKAIIDEDRKLPAVQLALRVEPTWYLDEDSASQLK
jgi:6-phosphogluconolactonase